MVVKGVSPDRSTKIMIKGDNIDDIILRFKMKLNLTEDNYKV